MRERDHSVERRIEELRQSIAAQRRQFGPWAMSPEVRRFTLRQERRLAMLLEHERTEGNRHA